MKIFNREDLESFLALLPDIREELAEWRLVTISIEPTEEANVQYFARKLRNHMLSATGDILICGVNQLIVLLQVGAKLKAKQLKDDISGAFPGYECHVEVTEVSPEGLQKIKLRVTQQEMPESLPNNILLQKKNRASNVILVAEDDLFMRTLLEKALKPLGTVILLEDGANVVESYCKLLPDIVYLDIHLPVKSGIDILQEILKVDPEAYVIMLSADSVKDNVLHAQQIGAKGFVAKPFDRKKLEEFLWKSPTAKAGAMGVL